MAILNTNEGAVAHMYDVAMAAIAADKGGEPKDVTVKLGAHEFTIAEVEAEITSVAPANKLEI